MNNEIQLLKSFFDYTKISAAQAAYEDIAKIKISETEQYYLCVVLSSIYEPMQVLCEFENYIIGLMNT
ncbi:HxsD-like protein [Butyrivibrio sp. MC2013]|uniref:HxsD-like protein n=1 Tax=Butyrivibrio sp. MC2013 TaxID=1280686 RepID=UPI000478C564|nr:HxsD-like protein [Butyrivibrio sp. MC2013]